jgi:hypothetical protein
MTELNYFGINFWNIHGLELSPKPRSTGELKTLPLNTSSHSINRLGVLSGTKVLALNRKDRAIQIVYLSLSPGKNKKEAESQSGSTLETYYEFRKKEEIIDFSAMGTDLYTLDQSRRSVTQLISSMGQGEPVGSWNIDIKGNFNQLKIIATRDKHTNTIAYIGPYDGNKFLKLFLYGRFQAEELTLQIPQGEKKLGAEVHLCADEPKGTLLIADTYNHRILEFDGETGETIILCGNGYPGISNEGIKATEARLNSPRGMAVYRAYETVKQDLLSDNSKRMLARDPSGILPRIILIADSGNYQIKKLVEFLDAHGSGNYSTLSSRLYTLLGSGKRSSATPGRPTSIEKDDLRQYSVSSPLDLAVLDDHTLIVRTEFINSLIMLQPATASSEVKAYHKTKEADIHDS